MEKEKEIKIRKIKRTMKEEKDISHNALINVLNIIHSRLSFMEIRCISKETPENFVDAILPVKSFYLLLKDLLTNLRKKDKDVLIAVDHFFSMVVKNMELNQTMEAYNFLKSIKY